MNRKKISRMIAGALATSVVLNSSPSAVESVHAITKDIYNEFSEGHGLEDDSDENSDDSDANENTTDNSGTNLPELSGVSIEQMQRDFEGFSNGNEVNLLSDGDDSSTKVTIGQGGANSSQDSTSVTNNSNFIYLSDLDYIDSLSRTDSPHPIRKNRNPDGNIITLQINDDGTTKQFGKGMAAHADTDLVYDISNYSDKFTKLTTWVGIDTYHASHKDEGPADGVTFKFYVSNDLDSDQWKQVGDAVTVKQGYTAKKVTIDVKDYKYVKLETKKNGYNWWDYSVYADLRLVEDGYDTDNEVDSAYTGFKTLQEYDSQISSRTVEENYANHKKQILEREFVNRIGYDNIILASRYVDGVSEALEWLQTDDEALQLFIEAGGYFSGDGYNAIESLGRLYKEYKADMNNKTYKKMLLATAAGYSKEIKTFVVNYGGNAVEANPVITYEKFKKLYDEGQFVRQSEFEKYPMELVRAVVDSRINNDEIIWLRNYVEKRYPSATELDNWSRYNGYGYTHYQSPNYGNPEFYDEANRDKWDKKYEFLKDGISYGNNGLARVWMVVEAGGICWGLSGLGMTVNEVQGIPAIGAFQPGHEAYLLYSENAEGKGMWSISDNISGWEGSYSRWYENTGIEHRLLLEWGQKDYNVLNSGNNVSYMLLAQDALNDYNNYLESMYYNLIANSYPAGSAEHEEALNESLKHYSKNLDSIHGLYKSYCADANTTDKEWLELARKVATEYRYFPAPMVDLLNIIKPHIKDEVLKIEVDMIQTESLNMASVATANESLQYDACIAVARSLLGQNGKELASFSFDGDNANTIVIDESYANSTIQVRVSLDGGKTWERFENNQEFTTSKSIKLTDEQIARVNADSDILVGLMGTTKNYCIDIKEGKTLGEDVYLNDDENLLIGDNTANLEYSFDDGATWNDYVAGLDSDTRIEGNREVLFRYKPHGVYLQGNATKRTFTENTVDPKSNYLQLKHVKLYQYCSQENGDKNHAAANFIDGSGKTSWHNTYDGEFDNKFYSVEFDKVRYISKLTYTPGHSFNGRLRSGEIYTSMDGQNWDKVHTFTELNHNDSTKEIVLPEAVEAKYLKLAVTDTYGNSDGERNKFISGSMLNFYEDTTKEYKADVKIEYSTENKTNKDVTAKLILPKDCVAVGETEHIFKDNGTFEFKYIDANKVEQSIIAEVNNIDRELPTMTYTFDNESLTNKDVTLTITEFSKANVRVVDIKEENSVVNPIVMARAINGNTNVTPNVYPNTYTFTENKTVVFTIADEAGNVNTIPVTVNWIDKDAPTADIQYDNTNPTNGQVKATLVNAIEDITITNLPQGQDYYIFDQNDSFTFEFVDGAGNKGTAIANVTWIDKDAPTATVEYDINSWTNGQVTATLVNPSEDITITNTTDGSNTVVFNENGNFTFEFVDKAGNKGACTAEVNWIDKDAPTATVKYSTKNPTTDPVTVELIGFSEDGVTIKNNDGKPYYTFKKNGEFEFIIVDKAGNETKVPVKVDWISDNAPNIYVEYNTEEFTNKNVTATLKGLPIGYEIVSDDKKDYHVFKDNGTYEFKVKDRDGNILTILAEVNWIDKEAPNAKVVYSTTSPTNKNVTATIQEFTESGVTIKNNGGSASYTFEQNGYFDFILVDKAGNETVIRAEVTWIDKVAPKLNLTYSNENPTNQNVTVTLDGLVEGDEIVNNNGNNTHTFEENGSFEFIVRDKAGNESRITAVVNWIDRIAPTATIAFDYSKAEEGKVIARLTDFSEEGITILNPSNGQDYYEFTSNGSFTFEFIDKAGNKGSAIANINWFDFNDIKTILQYEDIVENDNSSSDEVKPDYVVVKLSVDEEKVEILNNNGSNEVKFVKNGVFKFRARMIDTGEEFDIMVEVDWLAETAAEDESPIEIPTVDDSNDGNGNDSSNDSDDSTDKDDNTNDNPSVDDSDNSGDNDTSEENPDLDPDFGVDYEEEETPVEPPIEEPIAPPVNPDNNGGANNGDTTGSNSNGESNSSNNDSVNNSNNSSSNGELNNDKVTSNNLNSNNNNTNNSNSNTVSVSSNNVNSTGANVSHSEEVQINDSNKEFNTSLSDKESNRELETNASSDLTPSENSSEDFIEESENIDNSANKGLVATVISFITGLFGMIFAWFKKLF